MASSSNLPSITVSDLVKIVKMQMEEKNYRPIFGLGKGGIGKTESIYDLAVKELKIGYVDIRLLLYSETDLKGIPYPDANHVTTVWLQNNILPTVEKNGDTGILVLDEITSCGRSVRTAAYQLLNERKLGEYKLPDNWLIVCLGNGEEDGGDYQGIEGNFANRCSVFNVIADVDAWKDWALKQGVNPLVTGYISFKPHDLHTYNPENETEIQFASPRSWTAVSRILNKHEFNENDRVLKSRILANVGLRAGSQFWTFCKFKDKTVDPMDIVVKGLKPKITSEEVIHITIQSVVRIVGEEIIKSLDVDNSIHPETVKHLANALRWMVSLKAEYATMGFKDLMSYDKVRIGKILLSKELAQVCPEFYQFADENAGVFS